MSLSAYRRVLAQSPFGYKPQVFEDKDLCTRGILMLVPEPEKVPLKRTDMEATQGNQARLALKDTNDRLPGDCTEGRCLNQGLCGLDDLDPVLEGWVSREGDQVLVNAHKGKELLWDKF